MNSRKLVEEIKQRLATRPYQFRFDQKEDKLRIEHLESKKGVTLSLPGIVSRYETEKEKAIDDVIYYIDEVILAMQETLHIKGNEKRVYPVIRSTSFPTRTKEGEELVYKDHTAETRVFYALDMDQSYRLISQEMIQTEHISEDSLDEMARFNLRSLPTNTKEDHVAGNDFYFLNYNDGYDASRILNMNLLEEMSSKAKGQLTVATPHQDVLIFGDIQNQKGYDILAQMTMHFFSNGLIPITSLSFIYEQGKLDPIFILAKNKPIDEED